MLTIKKNKLLYLPFIFILIFAITNIDLVFSITANQITDRANYQDNIIEGEQLYQNSISSGFPLIFFTEPLFKLIYYIFLVLDIQPEVAIKSIIFFMTTSTFLTLLNRFKITPFWIIVLLLSPTVIVNYIMTIRQGFATVLFLLLVYNQNYKLKHVFIWLIPLFHYSFFIVNIIYYYSLYFSDNNNPYKKIFFVLFISFFSSIIILKIVNFLNLSYFIGYEDDLKFQFGLGIIFWFSILILFILEGKYFLRRNLFEVLSICFYVGSVSFFSPFSRILQAVSIFILIAGFELTGFRRQIFKIFLFLFTLYLIVPIFYNYNLGSMMLNN